jgi:sec-independent protein translocase protein TatB
VFDISFSELALCFVVALVVLGPERLPKVARTVGRWAGQARGYMRNLTSELERETQIMDLKRQLQEAETAVRQAARDAEAETQRVVADAGRDLDSKP